MNTESDNTSPAPVSAPRWKRMLPALLVGIAVLAPLIVGVLTPEPMVGDEVTHFYMLTTQADRLPAGNVEARIPLAYGGYHKKNYPHVFLWHYLGAVVWKATGGVFAAVQFYHILYWLQFLVAGWFLARAEAPARRDSAVIFLLVLASVPMNLLFSVAFYQDIPAAAQVLSAFAALRTGHWLVSVVFMALAFSLKISVLTMVPVYLCVMAWFGLPAGWKACILRPLAAAALLVSACVPSALALQKLEWTYYPAMQVEFMLRRAGIDWRLATGRRDAPQKKSQEHPEAKKERKKLRTPVNLARREEAYCPGDMRRPANIAIYGGVVAVGIFAAGLLWLGSLFLRGRRGAARAVPPYDPALPPTQLSDETAPETGPPSTSSANLRPPAASTGGAWTMVAGLAAMALTLLQIRDAPDIRFLLPALPLVLLPGALALGSLAARSRLVLPIIVAAATLQSGAVLFKTYQLRHIPAGITEVIAFLKANPPEPPRIFMYPEGHYRFFPVEHDWYLDFRLQDFWKSGNDERLAVLHERRIGAIVVKTDRIGKLDSKAMNLGIYPDTFVRDIKGDPRFRKVFQNKEVTVYAVPAEEKKAGTEQ